MTADTRSLLLTTARTVAQTGGYAALNFRDLASRLGIKSASVHYHFPTKQDLAVALMAAYADGMQLRLASIADSRQDLAAALADYVAVFRDTLSGGSRMCIYSTMSAEHASLPEAVRAELQRFAEINVRWLQAQLARASPAAAFERVRDQSLAIFAAVEGAQLVARERRDPTVYDAIVGACVHCGLIGPPR